MKSGERAVEAPTSRRGRWARLALRVAVTAGLAAVAVVTLDAQGVGAALIDARPPDLALALATHLLGVLAMAVRWRAMLRRDGAELGLMECLRLYLESFFVGLALPTIVGGDVYRALAIRRRWGGLSGAAVNVAAERVIGLMALLGLGSVGLLAHPVAGMSLSQRVAVVAMLVVGAVVAVTLLLRAGARKRESRLWTRVGPYIEQTRAYITPAPAGFVLLGLSLITHIMGVLSTYFCARAVAIDLPLSFFILLVPGLWLLTLLPALGGVGPKEGGMVVAMVQTGVPEKAAAAAAMLTLAARIVASAVGGISLLLRSDRGDG